jgi:hypothetical protein
MKWIWKTLKVIGITILCVLVLLTTIGVIISEDLPEGKEDVKADELARQILKELNYDAYKNTKVISWTFAGMHSYEWHKDENYVLVKSGDEVVRLNLKDYDSSQIISPKVKDNKIRQQHIQRAIKNFNNDSFWLIAPYKLMDDEVERRVVTMEEGEEALLITYTTGGSTPGDSYLWIVDENYRPKAFKMWVSIIPVGGVTAKWKDWVKTQSDMILSTEKSIFGLPISITNLETSN